MIGLIVTGIIVMIFIFGAYYVFRNSVLGKFMGNVLGGANALLSWTEHQFKNCSKDGLTSSKCKIGPWLIGALAILGIFGLAKVVGLLGIFKSDEAKNIEDNIGRELTAKDFEDALTQTNEKIDELVSKLNVEMSPEVREVFAVQGAIKQLGENLEKEGSIKDRQELNQSVQKMQNESKSSFSGSELSDAKDIEDEYPEFKDFEA